MFCVAALFSDRNCRQQNQEFGETLVGYQEEDTVSWIGGGGGGGSDVEVQTLASDIQHSTWSVGEYAALEESVKRLCISLDTLCEDVLSPSSSLSLSRECTTIHARSCVVLCTTIHARSCVVLYHDTHTSCVVLIDVEFYTTEKFTVHAEEKTQPQLSPLSLH